MMSSLKTEVLRLLDDARLLCSGVAEAQPLMVELNSVSERLNQPLRVAVVGVMKAGKSTFMNALMGKNIVSVDALEATYTVCWFRYADKASLDIFFRNGDVRHEPFEKLGWWSERRSGNSEIDEVRYLVINYPSEILKKIEFIDTPGLNSSYNTDSQNTLDFLAVRGSEETVMEASKADAIIYAFNRSLSGEDAKLLKEFTSGNFVNHSPLNSIGILTRVDNIGDFSSWPDGSPVKGAAPIVNTSMNDPMVKKMLYSIFPVCALPVEGCSKLSEGDWESLKSLSGVAQGELEDILFSASIGGTDELEALGENAVRLNKILGQYGLLELTRLLREEKTREEIVSDLSYSCGITGVKDVILRHFGNRTFMIKVEYIFNRLRSVTEGFIRDTATGYTMRNVCVKLNDLMDNIMSDHIRMREIEVLQMYYAGRFNVKNDVEREELFQITGEYGPGVEARLGVDGKCTISELKKIALEKMRRWRYKAAVSVMDDVSYISSAQIIARSYEQILNLLKQLDEV